ncbi:cytochrome c maturation protein CcmE [Stakelama sp. CBK3Z-3]|uniref:Cytochrome c-type biogenesis protein CcmE n=1 Tax=Stakelama flava TaxID=2860338 RepID=A0ABS6XH56_9SPHN|nr:cytochrome c maturation protein CcmE [Stakelama flava]MBW4329552.1 cytochrome c maturation protein CcmE [Stakelama flava]
MKPKHQRFVLAGLALLAIFGASALALSALRDEAAFFYAPADIVGHLPDPNRSVRLGGMVKQGSVERQGDGVTIRFVVTDGKASVPVRFTGVTPDLFREGSGVVAEGHFRADGGFTADTLLAKHDERYMPPQMAGKMHKTESLKP